MNGFSLSCASEGKELKRSIIVNKK